MSIRILLTLVLLYCTRVFSETDAVQECIGCHTEQRHEPIARFSNGFGQWSDLQCVGCHTEIDEVSQTFTSGVHDSRYLSLPVTDKRLKSMKKYPLPYLKAPLNISKEPQRLNQIGLIRFLRRPPGYCKTPNSCAPPMMMVYPDISLSDLAPLKLNLSKEPISSKLIDIKAGEALFTQRCSTCHSNDKAPYDDVALSLFSHKNIASFHVKKPQEVNEKVLDLTLSSLEATQLQAYFMRQRDQREQQLERAIPLIQKDWQAIAKKTVSYRERIYLWNDFWRDGGCVHCHGIEGRAKNKFDVSHAGLTKYLSQYKGQQIYTRLKIKHLETKFGVSAGTPGMPMTGSPMPTPLIQLIGSWLKSGCQNIQGTQLCPEKP